MPDSFSGLQEIKITPFLSDFHHIDQTWFVVSFLSVVSQPHSTRGLQTMSSLYVIHIFHIFTVYFDLSVNGSKIPILMFFLRHGELPAVLACDSFNDTYRR